LTALSFEASDNPIPSGLPFGRWNASQQQLIPMTSLDRALIDHVLQTSMEAKLQMRPIPAKRCIKKIAKTTSTGGHLA
jgi:hypothetical protein